MLGPLLVALAIVSICVFIHVLGMLLLFRYLMTKREVLKEEPSFSRSFTILMSSFGVIIMLHMFEASIWALFYYMRELFADFETSFYYSLTCYTTMGFGDVVLPRSWRLLGGLEGISGVLLCGLSTAFLFLIISALIEMHHEEQAAKKKPAE